MKNAKNVIVGAMMAMTIATYANANTLNKTSVHILASVEEKGKVSGVNKVLPVSLPVLETPAPHVAKNSTDTNKQNANQKAAIVGLQLKSNTTK